MHHLRRLRFVGLAEGLSFVALLGIAMPLKYFAGMPMAVRITGSVHGFLFVAYCICIFLAVRANVWPKGKAAMLVIASLLPFGPMFVDGQIRAAQRTLPA